MLCWPWMKYSRGTSSVPGSPHSTSLLALVVLASMIPLSLMMMRSR